MADEENDTKTTPQDAAQTPEAAAEATPQAPEPADEAKSEEADAAMTRLPTAVGCRTCRPATSLSTCSWPTRPPFMAPRDGRSTPPMPW